MGAFKSKQPRANLPLCWECNRKLYGNGTFYAVVEVDGHRRIVHNDCGRELIESGRGEPVPDETHRKILRALAAKEPA